MIVITIAFVSGIPAAYMPESLNAETSHAYHAQVSFISGFVGLLTDPFMCGGFSLAQTHCFSLLSGPWQPFQWPVFTACRFLCTENNTLEIQLLSEFCHPLCTLWFIGCKRREEIPSVSGILTQFPCSANKNACPIARVAHLPQKPCYSVYYMRACFTHTKRPLLPCYLAGKRSLVFSIYSVSVYAKITFLFK